MADGSISRTLRVLTAVCERGPIKLKDLSDATGLTPPTLLRTLRLMAEEGYVTQTEDRAWHASMKVWRLGCAVNEVVGIASLARRHTDRIAEELNEASVYAVYEQGTVTYSALSEPARPVWAHVEIGRRNQMLATPSGIVVLAWLPEADVARATEDLQPHVTGFEDRESVDETLREARLRGYVSRQGVRWPELWGVAAPVFDAQRQPIGALAVVIPSAQQSVRDPATLAVVREAAALTTSVGGRAPHRNSVGAEPG